MSLGVVGFDVRRTFVVDGNAPCAALMHHAGGVATIKHRRHPTEERRRFPLTAGEQALGSGGVAAPAPTFGAADRFR